MQFDAESEAEFEARASGLSEAEDWVEDNFEEMMALVLPRFARQIRIMCADPEPSDHISRAISGLSVSELCADCHKTREDPMGRLIRLASERLRKEVAAGMVAEEYHLEILQMASSFCAFDHWRQEAAYTAGFREGADAKIYNLFDDWMEDCFGDWVKQEFKENSDAITMFFNRQDYEDLVINIERAELDLTLARGKSGGRASRL